jgi:fluoroquinolone transport system permease protein
MASATAVRGMLKADALRLSRDRFLLSVTVYLLFVFALMRVAIPWMTGQIASSWDFDLTPFHPLIVSHFTVQLAPWIPGIVGGFLLLECREDGTVKALLVSPTPLRTYVSVACAVMFVIALAAIMAAAVLIGLRLPPWLPLVAVGLTAASAGPAVALLIASISDNKVQAFAYLKLFGIGPVMASGGYFLPERWQWLAAIYPPYCASKAYWLAEAGGSQWPLWVLGGLVGSAIWLRVLHRLYLKAARK